MKTLTATQLRPKIGSWLDRVLKGEDIGLTWKGKIIALRPVEVHSDDYVLAEYGADEASADKTLKRAEREIRRTRRHGRVTVFKGTLRG